MSSNLFRVGGDGDAPYSTYVRTEFAAGDRAQVTAAVGMPGTMTRVPATPRWRAPWSRLFRVAAASVTGIFRGALPPKNRP